MSFFPPPDNRYTGGFTYIGLMIFIALMGIGLALAGQVWHTATQREKEKELLFAGDQFRAAITKYYEGSPGGATKFPNSLEDLLDDRRYPTTKRHLRKIFRDPMTGETRWGLVESPTGGIMGVYSLSEHEPRKISGFRPRDEAFEGAASYSDWQFAYAVAVPPEQAAATPAPGVPQDSGGGGPVTVPPEPAPVQTVPSKDDPNRKQLCDSILRTDKSRCALERFNAGTDAGLRCDDSAAARNAACMQALPIPLLVTAGD